MPDIGQTQTATGIIDEITEGDRSLPSPSPTEIAMQFPATPSTTTPPEKCPAQIPTSVQQSLKIHEADTLIFERQWDEEIPRDMV